jgi:DNA primase
MSFLNDFIEKCNQDLLNNNDKEFINAKKYLFEDRKLDINSIINHKIGYCHSNSIVPDEIKYFGNNASKKWDISDRILGRIILPIYSEMGVIDALASKLPTMEKGFPWWNLPKPFHKGNYLFLLDKAKKSIFDKNKIYIVEGYIDAITLYQHGLKNVVALMGTAYTLRKIALTIRYCNNVCLCFDCDKNQAGQNAKKMAISILNKYSFCESISTIDYLPMDEDPASFVSNNGIGKFLEMERIIDEEEIYKICLDISRNDNKRLLDAK